MYLYNTVFGYKNNNFLNNMHSYFKMLTVHGKWISNKVLNVCHLSCFNQERQVNAVKISVYYKMICDNLVLTESLWCLDATGDQQSPTNADF